MMPNRIVLVNAPRAKPPSTHGKSTPTPIFLARRSHTESEFNLSTYCKAAAASAILVCALHALAEEKTSPAPSPSSTTATPTATAAKPTAYKTERWEEDYFALRNPAARTDPLDFLKFIPLNSNGDWYVTLGGLVRDRYEYFNHNTFGAGAQDRDGYNLLRISEYADLHLGPNVRIFLEGRSAFENDRVGGPRGPDLDEMDPQQMFADFMIPCGDKAKFTFRAGRQELLFGAERLIGPADFSNVRKTFDGFRATLACPNNTLDAFVVRPVVIDKYNFDFTNNAVVFAGLYDTLQLPHLIHSANSKLEAYGLYLERRSAAYSSDPGSGREQRYTLGTRFTTNPKPFDLDIEADFQFGRFNSQDICAYSLAIDAGYTFSKVTFAPRINLGFDIASGGGHSGDNQGTFNQLFPSGHAYFGFIDTIGRQNIIDLHPGFELNLISDAKYAQKVTLRADYHQFWRQSDNDALYNNSGAVVRGGGGSNSSSIGGELDLLLKWQIDRHISTYVGYSHFFHGAFITETGASDDIDFVYAALTFTF